jgi:hypothetical protein
MTGIQALERKEPDQPMRPGKRERKEARVYSPRNPNGNIASACVASGQVVQSSVGDTRTEAD